MEAMQNCKFAAQTITMKTDNISNIFLIVLSREDRLVKKLTKNSVGLVLKKTSEIPCVTQKEKLQVFYGHYKRSEMVCVAKLRLKRINS